MPEEKATYEAPDPARRARVGRVMAAYEALMQGVSANHARELLGVDVTMPQAKVLYLVQAEPDIRMSNLAARMGVAVSTMSGVVDRLVDRQLLIRRDDPSDRRHALVRITDAGANEVEHLRELTAGQVESLVARIDDADLEIVERALVIFARAAAAPHSPGLLPLPTTQGVPA